MKEAIILILGVIFLVSFGIFWFNCSKEYALSVNERAARYNIKYEIWMPDWETALDFWPSKEFYSGCRQK